MSKRVVFRGLEHSPVIEEHINNQLAKIDAFLSKERGPNDVSIAVEQHEKHAVNKVALHVRVTFNSDAHSQDIHVKKEGNELYRVIDETIDTAYRDLLNKKQEIVDDRRKQPKTNEVVAEELAAEEPEDADDFE